VSLYKRTEASSDGRTRVLGYAFPNGGTLLGPPPLATRRIEVVGDSISCGYGVLGPDATCTGTSAYEDHDDSYGAITARNLGADLHTISSSGKGMYVNIDGTTTGTLPDIYGLTLPYVSAGTPSAWDFAGWTPDAVVIDLGTNDFYGSSTGDPGQPFVTAYLAFVQQVRLDYPDAWILCTNGPILSGTQYAEAQAYIEAVVAMMDDPKVTFLGFPTQNPANGEGCQGHPSVTTHELMAAQLTTALESALGW
jgi:lysophospholipase L1-like esterase